jgi:hypothetical protein
MNCCPTIFERRTAAVPGRESSISTGVPACDVNRSVQPARCSRRSRKKAGGGFPPLTRGAPTGTSKDP